MWQEILVAIGLVLILEGILPFLNPAAWRRALLTLTQMDDRWLRIMGLSSMLVGLLIIHLLK
jgi:uncharacterized protein YjeT (DUF2065 family)